MLKAITSSTSLLLYYLAASRRVNPDRDNLCIYYYLSHKCIHTRSRVPYKTVVCCVYRYDIIIYIVLCISTIKPRTINTSANVKRIGQRTSCILQIFVSR